MAVRVVSAVGLVIIALNASARSQALDFGKTEFSSKCAECHGADGKGTGPRSADMKKKPANLTILAKKKQWRVCSRCRL
jgi:mono/diheme cytochrome c family protein